MLEAQRVKNDASALDTRHSKKGVVLLCRSVVSLAEDLGVRTEALTDLRAFLSVDAQEESDDESVALSPQTQKIVFDATTASLLGLATVQ